MLWHVCSACDVIHPFVACDAHVHVHSMIVQALVGVIPGDTISFQLLRNQFIFPCLVTIGAVGYTPEQVAIIRRLASIKETDWEAQLQAQGDGKAQEGVDET